MNPAWIMGMKYPDAELGQYSVNSPDIRFWTMVSRSFGIPMIDWDHALRVSINDHPTAISLGDFIGADELYVKNSEVDDISAFWDPDARLYDVKFRNCDFSSMPPEQRARLKQGTSSKSYFIPYDSEIHELRYGHAKAARNE